ncbi:MAG: MaoC family dehydratase, partial [Nanoarchaeota archaeon]
MNRTATIVFTRKNIEDFCELTGDTNPIHNTGYMLCGEKPKEPIIPGMMLFAHALSRVNSGQIDSLRQVSLYFTGVNCSNQEITFLRLGEADYLEISARVNLNGQGESETSHIYLSPKTSSIIKLPSNLRNSVLLQEPKSYQDFHTLIKDYSLQTNFLYTLCRSSAALLDRVKMPSTPEEKEISDSMAQGERS